MAFPSQAKVSAILKDYGDGSSRSSDWYNSKEYLDILDPELSLRAM